jgi:hypothetical protein
MENVKKYHPYRDDLIDLYEFPSIIWRKEYETNPKKLSMLVQHISDYMLLVAGMPWNVAKNPPINRSMFEGNLSEEEVDEVFSGVLYAFGERGAGELQDYKFFTQDYKAIESNLLKMPFEISFKATTAAYEEKKLSKAAERVAAFMRNAIIDQTMQETGENLEDLKDPSASNISRLDQLIEKMSAPDELEMVTARLVKNYARLFNFNDEFREVNKDHFTMNCMYSHIDTSEGTPRIKHVPANSVNFISPVPVRDMDDPNIIAWSVRNYISINNALSKYGDTLALHEGMGRIKDMIYKLRSGDSNEKYEYYNPYLYANDYYPLVETQHSTYENYDILTASENMRNFYSPLQSTGMYSSAPIGILEHKIYFKVMKYDKCVVLVNGKNPSKEQAKMMKSGIVVPGVTYRVVEDDYKAKANEMIRNRPYEELWEATRLGHSVFVGIQKYQYQTRYERDHKRVYPPVVGTIIHEDSMVSTAKSLYITYNKLMYIVDEKVNTAGADNVLLYDNAQATMTVKEAILQAKKFGVLEFNSSAFTQKENTMANKHLSKLDMSDRVESIINYLKAADIIKQTWADTIGLSLQAKGEAGKYDSAAKVDRLISQSSNILYSYMRDDYEHRRRTIKRYADIIRRYAADNPSKISSLWDGAVREIASVSKDLSIVDMELDMVYGYEALNDKEDLLRDISAGVASGVTDIETLIEAKLANSPSEIRAIFKASREKVAQQREAMQQQQSQIAQGQAEIDKAAKVDVPIQKEQIKAQAAQMVAEIRAGAQAEDRTSREDQVDIQEANSRQRSVLDSLLQSESQNTQQQEGEIQ